ncbi:MAG: hypothetical protein JW938_01340 [Candidatus Omnitrophica bacterium]|nr:hypothetical protein [Candidatus Omnitrophota bacterium]
MFLDDISRKINKQKKGWERWDDHRSLDLTEYQTIVDFIGDIALLCIKNIGDINIAIEMNGMQTRLKGGEEKYFTRPAGRQVILHVKEAGGRVFIGQSVKGDITSIAVFCFLVLSLVCTGCASTKEHEPFKPDPFATPKAPATAPVPRTPGS